MKAQTPHHSIELMKLENAIRVLAGTFVLISLALAHWVNPWWLLPAAFVGLTSSNPRYRLRPAEIILKNWASAERSRVLRTETAQ
jgi:hypothetical protein